MKRRRPRGWYWIRCLRGIRERVEGSCELVLWRVASCVRAFVSDVLAIGSPSHDLVFRQRTGRTTSYCSPEGLHRAARATLTDEPTTVRVLFLKRQFRFRMIAIWHWWRQLSLLVAAARGLSRTLPLINNSLIIVEIF